MEQLPSGEDGESIRSGGLIGPRIVPRVSAWDAATVATKRLGMTRRLGSSSIRFGRDPVLRLVFVMFAALNLLTAAFW